MYNLNQILITKKTHACGGNEWTVVRVGADYKIKCNKCGRIIMAELPKLNKMVKKVKNENNL